MTSNMWKLVLSLGLVAAANADCRFSGNTCGGGACSRTTGFPRSGTCESNSGKCRCCSGLPGSPNRECWSDFAEVQHKNIVTVAAPTHVEDAWQSLVSPLTRTAVSMDSTRHCTPAARAIDPRAKKVPWALSPAVSHSTHSSHHARPALVRYERGLTLRTGQEDGARGAARRHRGSRESGEAASERAVAHAGCALPGEPRTS